jgi:hypothetical protein
MAVKNCHAELAVLQWQPVTFSCIHCHSVSSHSVTASGGPNLKSQWSSESALPGSCWWKRVRRVVLSTWTRNTGPCKTVLCQQKTKHEWLFSPG